MRGEFGRLLCVLADAEQHEWLELDKVESRSPVQLPPAWWQMPDQRERVKAQLKLCLEVLEQQDQSK